ncbi:protein amalgam-like [Panonychus citri]|uniref:protein amalgam-like n=1 Tax=Panonychus citri TaxID=50023 RepID=UPI002307E6C8|nr:protein amalgam-like [Panonychus citri]XP_053205624.1 protein amalgam-like [Panonychus citri]
MMKIIFVIFVCLFSEQFVSINGYPNNINNDHYASDGSETEEIAKNHPKIKSKALTLAANEGDTITFPCEVDDLGSLSVTWGSKKGSNVTQLFFGSYRFLQDDRVYLDGTNLVIKNVKQTDSGIYTCKVSTDKEISVNHTFFVNGRPQIMKEPATGNITIGQGQTLKLTCKSTVDPKPDIKWEKLDSKLTVSATNQETLTIPNVGRLDSGRYRCSAFSFYGSDNHADFEVVVEEEPEIELPEPHVYTGIGQEIKLRCRVYGNPTPNVYFENSRGNRLPSKPGDNKEYVSTLSIRDENDFGKYSCYGFNKFGKKRADIEVSGRPSRPIILNSDADFPTSGDEFELKYQVTSYSPITKVLVTYRYTKDTESFSDWNTTEIDPNNVNGPSYNLKYILQNMDRKTYEVRVYAENKYGRSEGSEIYSITADGAKEHWKVAGSSSYSIKSSSTILFICSLLLLATMNEN